MLAQQIGPTAACDALGLSRSSLYAEPRPPKERAPAFSPRKLRPEEKTAIGEVLNSDRFADQTPREIYATLLDDDQRHLCSVSSMYRILREKHQIRERRDQRRLPVYAKPRLEATGPNQVWTWDITKLPGPNSWVHFCLYVVLDLFSRFVVGWMVAKRESALLAEQLLTETYAQQKISPGQLTIHSDRGAPMIAKSLALLFVDLGVDPSLARPRTPDDNPFSEAQFKTLKYHPSFPEAFGDILDARTWGQRFFQWYNNQHHHTGLGLLTPAVVHLGQAEIVRQARQQVLLQAYAAHPERFVRGLPFPPALPGAVWINPPKPAENASSDTGDIQ
jgi:putative transposase